MASQDSDSDDSNTSLLSPTLTSSSIAPSSSLSQAISAVQPSIASSSDPSLLRSRSTKRTSKVWDYYRYERYYIARDTQHRSIWACKLCSRTYIEAGGLKNARKHLRNTHNVAIDTKHNIIVGQTQLGTEKAIARGGSQSQTYKRRRLDGTDRPSTLDPAVLEDLYITWITTHSVAFKMVEYQAFRSYVALLNTTI
jgi:hypothetical protein